MGGTVDIFLMFFVTGCTSDSQYILSIVDSQGNLLYTLTCPDIPVQRPDLCFSGSSKDRCCADCATAGVVDPTQHGKIMFVIKTLLLKVLLFTKNKYYMFI